MFYKFTVVIKTEDDRYDFHHVEAKDGQAAISKVLMIASYIKNVSYTQAICQN